MAELIISPKSVKNVRDENQDVFAHFDTGYGSLFILADGMGGASGGFEAANLTVNRFPRHLEKAKAAGMTPGDALVGAARGVNRDVFSLAKNSSRRMGSTLVAALETPRGFLVVHLGDSRAYLLRDNQLVRLTRDHSAVQVWMDEGRMTEEEARTHPRRSLLTRAVGVQEEVEPELRSKPVPLNPGDSLLLCSDGLCGFARDVDIEHTLVTTREKRDMADALVKLALSSGSDDNTTVLFLHRPRISRGVAQAHDRGTATPKRDNADDDTQPNLPLITPTAQSKRLKQFAPLVLVLIVGIVFIILNYSRGLTLETAAAPASNEAAAPDFQPTEIDHKADYNWAVDICPSSLAEKARSYSGAFGPAMKDVMETSPAQEQALALAYAKEAEALFGDSLDTDPVWVDYLNELGAHLLKHVARPEVAYTFHYVDLDDAKALALPGGHIYVFRGLLDHYIKNEAQLIYVLAREIRHVDSRQALALDQVIRSQIPQAAAHELVPYFLNHSFSLAGEKEADRVALQVLVSEGYSPFQAHLLMMSRIGRETVDHDPEQPMGAMLQHVADRLPSHPGYRSRACAIKNQTVGMLPMVTADTFYVGQTNFKTKTPAWIEKF